MKTIYSYEEQGFVGVDVNLEISLFEYGLIWKETNKGEYKFIYGVSVDDKGNYRNFDWSTLTDEEIKEIQNEDWFDLAGFESFIGEDATGTVQDVHAMVQYHGTENILGSSYYPFEVAV